MGEEEVVRREKDKRERRGGGRVATQKALYCEDGTTAGEEENDSLVNDVGECALLDAVGEEEVQSLNILSDSTAALSVIATLSSTCAGGLRISLLGLSRHE